jgi:hypothetical protein
MKILFQDIKQVYQELTFDEYEEKAKEWKLEQARLKEERRREKKKEKLLAEQRRLENEKREKEERITYEKLLAEQRRLENEKRAREFEERKLKLQMTRNQYVHYLLITRFFYLSPLF